MGSRLEIALAGPSALVVLRNADGADETTVSLAGTVTLRLHEPTDVKDIRLSFTGRARLHVVDAQPPYRSHSLDEVFHREEISVLSALMPGSSTLQAGTGSFPFSFAVPQDLPASVRTVTNSASIEYRLKACVSEASGRAHAQDRHPTRHHRDQLERLGLSADPAWLARRRCGICAPGLRDLADHRPRRSTWTISGPANCRIRSPSHTRRTRPAPRFRATSA